MVISGHNSTAARHEITRLNHPYRPRQRSADGSKRLLDRSLLPQPRRSVAIASSRLMRTSSAVVVATMTRVSKVAPQLHQWHVESGRGDEVHV
jgi:hypothetical protein